LHLVSRRVASQSAWKLSKWQQWAVTVVFLILAGAPFTHFDHWKGLIELMNCSLIMFDVVILACFFVSLFSCFIDRVDQLYFVSNLCFHVF
jgi:hypothetical protein